MLITPTKVVASYFLVFRVDMANLLELCNAIFSIDQNELLEVIPHFWKEKIAQFLIGILRRLLDGFMQIPSLS